MLVTELCSYSTDMICVYTSIRVSIYAYISSHSYCVYMCVRETDRQIHTHRNWDREGGGGRTRHVTEAGFLGLSALDSACGVAGTTDFLMLLLASTLNIRPITQL